MVEIGIAPIKTGRKKPIPGELQHIIAAPSVKLQLAAIRMLFDWLVVGQILPTNPAAAVRGPKHSVKKGKRPVLTADEARTLLDAIQITQSPASLYPRIIGLRDRAIIALLTYTFACVGAAVQMRVLRTYTFKDAAPGPASMKKAASVTKCPAITILKLISRPISRPPASATIAKARSLMKLKEY